MSAVRRGTAEAADAHAGGAAGKHALNAEAGPGAYTVAKFFEEQIPAVIDGEE